LLTSLSEYSPNVRVPFGGLSFGRKRRCILLCMEYSFGIQTNLLVIGDFAWKLELLIPAKNYEING
jgi:hypothetical protein